MPDADDIADAIAENATGPQSVTVDSNTVVQKTTDDQIKAANYVAGKAARSNASGTLGLTMRKLRPVYE